MMKIEFHANEAHDWCLGLAAYSGHDEHGEFQAIEFGIGFFSVLILKYG